MKDAGSDEEVRREGGGYYLKGGLLNNFSVRGGFLIYLPRLSWVCFITAGDADILET